MARLSAPFSDQELLDHIAASPPKSVAFRHLVRELGLRGARRETLAEALARLAGRGELVELRGGQYAVVRGSREYVTGRLNLHRDGYGFVTPVYPVTGLAGDVFIGADEAARAMHGDRVAVRLGRIGEDGRASGEIVRVLERAHPTVVGEFVCRRHGNFVRPDDDRIRDWIYIPEGLESPPREAAVDRIGAPLRGPLAPEDLDGMIVNVEVLEFPEKGESGAGRVIEVLGAPDDFGVDVEIVIRKHHLPHRFPPEALEQAERLSPVIRAEEAARRRDFRHLDAVTIDGETARDFDDAVWVDALAGGRFRLDVHIADVSHYVRPGTPIDTEAARRGTSVYFPDRAVPMLPLELSTDLCSLVPGADRLTLSVSMEIDRQGDVVAREFHRGIIRSAERMTYTSVHLLLEGDAGLRERYARLVDRFEMMRELALILNRRRMKRGSIDFDLPEAYIEFDAEGLMTGIQRAPRNIAHRIIEEFMLAANETVAGFLEKEAGVPTLFRIHEPPEARRVMEFEEIAVGFGHSLGFGAFPVRRFPVVDRKRDGRKVRRDLVLPEERLPVTSRHYQKLVEKLAGRPEERILSYLMLRSLRQARYSAGNTGHFALAAPSYTHFTSPIRRYPDLVVHRILGAVLGQAPPPLDADALKQAAEDCSFTERRAAEAERELLDWKKLKFMAERVGEDFPALIIGVGQSGFFVELEDLFVEGFLPLDVVPAHRRLSIGDRVRVLLARVDALQKQLLFSLKENPGQ